MASIPQGQGVYLIHFDQPLKHAQHYIGYSSQISAREVLHRRGRGSRLVKIVNDAGIAWNIVRTWPGKTRSWERSLKNRKNAKHLCPVCNPFSAERYPTLRTHKQDVQCPF